jgi:hypothetical protein
MGARLEFLTNLNARGLNREVPMIVFHRRQSSRLRHRPAGFPLVQTGRAAGRRGLGV